MGNNRGKFLCNFFWLLFSYLFFTSNYPMWVTGCVWLNADLMWCIMILKQHAILSDFFWQQLKSLCRLCSYIHRPLHFSFPAGSCKNCLDGELLFYCQKMKNIAWGWWLLQPATRLDLIKVLKSNGKKLEVEKNLLEERSHSK